MWIVVDWHFTKAYGPFETKEQVEEWLAKQGIYPSQYESNDVSINQLLATTEKLAEIN